MTAGIKSSGPKRVLAVASGGGHWVQLQRMMPAFSSHEVAFVTTLDSYRKLLPQARIYVVSDVNRNAKIRLVWLVLRLIWIICRERPDVVVSTGAAPGYVAVRLGKWFGANTVWIDSVANTDRLSRSGEKIGSYADLWLTQWPHLARPQGPHFVGSVL